mmetsp:Transcript_27102/g.90025  ORF Transcript_27102/g.90025 Transcript_27102/m.90025 type:complete len:209 (-) Transcript_27102:921-1547(-)
MLRQLRLLDVAPREVGRRDALVPKGLGRIPEGLLPCQDQQPAICSPQQLQPASTPQAWAGHEHNVEVRSAAHRKLPQRHRRLWDVVSLQPALLPRQHASLEVGSRLLNICLVVPPRGLDGQHGPRGELLGDVREAAACVRGLHERVVQALLRQAVQADDVTCDDLAPRRFRRGIQLGHTARSGGTYTFVAANGHASAEAVGDDRTVGL